MVNYRDITWVCTTLGWLCLAGFPVPLINVIPGKAQPIPDTTLPRNSIVNTSNNRSIITGGTQAGGNLFHSFERFNIRRQQTVDFHSPSNTRNILVRVTGRSRSDINGRLSASGSSNPNLFLINPNGIFFGSAARLNIGGSFIATTANAIGFNNQGSFSASVPNNPTLLTVHPSAFLFNRIPIQPIVSSSNTTNFLSFEGDGLTLPNGQSLLLVGGDVRLDSGNLVIPDGQVELGGLADLGVVNLHGSGNNLRLDFPRDATRADVSLINGGSVDVLGRSYGRITISAHNIDIKNESGALQAGAQENSSARMNGLGSIVLDANGQIAITGSSVNQGQGSGHGGNIRIIAGSLFLVDSQLATIGEDGSSDIDINVSDRVFLKNSEIFTDTFGAGNAGRITINTHRGSILLTNGSLISTRTNSSGNAGNINIRAREVSLLDGAQIAALTTGAGNSGNIQIRASDTVRIVGVGSENRLSSGLITATESQNGGRGGNITIDTGLLSLADGAVLSARTRSAARGGDITVNAQTLEAINGGQVITSTFSSGDAGDITIDAQDQIILSGTDPTYADRMTQGNSDVDRSVVIDNDSFSSGIFARARTGTIANAGDITITTPFLYLNDQGRIGTDTTAGQGGAIRLQNLDVLLMRRNSSISASAGTANRGGDGGNISIDSQFILAAPSENSDITANAFTGRGGNVSINAEGLLGIRSQLQPTPASDITASSERGVQGNVTIRSPEVNPTQGLVELPTNLIDASRAIAPVCPTADIRTANNSSQNQFIVTGRGGLPLNADEALSSDAVQVDLVTAEATETASERSLSLPETHPTEKAIVEAQGWIVDADGNVMLTASAPTVIAQGSRPNLIAMECPAQSRSSS